MRMLARGSTRIGPPGPLDVNFRSRNNGMASTMPSAPTPTAGAAHRGRSESEPHASDATDVGRRKEHEIGDCP